MFSGGNTGDPASRKKTSYLLSKDGLLKPKPLTKARWLHCSAILSSNESVIEVGILGGEGAPGTGRSMERYRCVKRYTNGTCDKLSDGPHMIKGDHNFGCGTLQTGQGGRVLLAIGDIKKPTQVLNLGNKESKWEILSADMDVPYKEEQGFPYSFVTSTTEPTVGYFLPKEKQYIYRVKCEDAQTCSFEKIDTGYKNPTGSVTMAIPADAFSCP